MRKLEHRVAAARTSLRLVRARMGLAAPGIVKPARIVVRLGAGDLADSMGDGDALTPAAWQKLLVSAVSWLGPAPVTFLAPDGADHPFLMDLVRFAHRLECHTLLVTNGTGIDTARAEELVDRGLAAARVWVGGVSAEVHGQVVGNPVSESAGALDALLAARQDRGMPLDVEVALPWQGPADVEARAVLGWARQVGADGFRLVAPWLASNLPADPELVDALCTEGGSFNRTPPATAAGIHAMVARQDGQPGTPRADWSGPGRRCPVGGQRVEISANGRVSACPFKAPIGTADDDLPALWKTGRDHLQQIASCERACVHAELAPALLFR